MKLNFTSGMVLLLVAVFATPVAVLSYRALNSPPEPSTAPSTQILLLDSPLTRIAYSIPEVKSKPKPTPKPKPTRNPKRTPTPVPTATPTSVPPTPTPTIEPPVSGLVAWWHGEGNANDVVGTNHGTLQNGATFAIGKVGQSFLFDGVDDHVLIPFNGSLQSPIFSISVWVKPLSVIDDFVDGGTQGQEAIFVQNGASPHQVVWPGQSGLKAMFALRPDGPKAHTVVSNAELLLDEFTHVVGTWDGTNGKVYINGQLDVESIFTEELRVLTCPYFIGGIGPVSTTPTCEGWGGGQFFNALIDEVKLYDRALTADEVQAIFNDS